MNVQIILKLIIFDFWSIVKTLHTIERLQGNCTMLLDSAEALMFFWRSFCFSAFFLAPVFFLGIFTYCMVLQWQVGFRGQPRDSNFRWFRLFGEKKCWDTMEEQRDTTAPDEAMEVGDAKFKENIWYKKYQLLKRKCSEFEQVCWSQSHSLARPVIKISTHPLTP